MARLLWASASLRRGASGGKFIPVSLDYKNLGAKTCALFAFAPQRGSIKFIATASSQIRDIQFRVIPRRSKSTCLNGVLAPY
jgi:hypothetical protein